MKMTSIVSMLLSATHQVFQLQSRRKPTVQSSSKSLNPMRQTRQFYSPSKKRGCPRSTSTISMSNSFPRTDTLNFSRARISNRGKPRNSKNHSHRISLCLLDRKILMILSRLTKLLRETNNLTNKVSSANLEQIRSPTMTSCHLIKKQPSVSKSHPLLVASEILRTKQ